jgi:hypothetical protein
MSGLTATVHEMMQHQMDRKMQQKGVAQEDIDESYQVGMHPMDVRVFRDWSLKNLLFVIRLPKLNARPWHGVLPPKIMAVKAKTGDFGVVVTSQRVDGDGDEFQGQALGFVSDYDMMSVWKSHGTGWEKIFISAANGAARGPWQAEARWLVQALNKELVSKLQHGCQDDYQSIKNPGVKQTDRFGFFIKGAVQVCDTREACAKAYKENGLEWPYDQSGKYIGEVFDAR